MAVYSTSQEVATTDNSRVVQGRVIPKGQRPRTEYIYVGDQNQGQSRTQRVISWRPQPHAQVNMPRPIPQWLGNARIIGYSWVAAMILVGFDEWKNHGILPRPVRLWDTSIVFGLLALASVVEPLIGLLNALAIGYVIMLLWQFYNGQGQFGDTSKPAHQVSGNSLQNVSGG